MIININKSNDGCYRYDEGLGRFEHIPAIPPLFTVGIVGLLVNVGCLSFCPAVFPFLVAKEIGLFLFIGKGGLLIGCILGIGKILSKSEK